MAAWKLVYQRLNHKSFPKPFSENQMNTGTNESGVLVKENDKFNPVRKTSQRHAMVVCPETRMIRRTDEGFGWKKTQISILYRKNSPSPDPPNAPLMPPTLSHCIVVAPWCLYFQQDQPISTINKIETLANVSHLGTLPPQMSMSTFRFPMFLPCDVQVWATFTAVTSCTGPPAWMLALVIDRPPSATHPTRTRGKHHLPLD